MSIVMRQPSLFDTVPETPAPIEVEGSQAPETALAGSLIPFGYRASGAEALLTRLMADSRALLCDLRYSPYAPRCPQWDGSALQRQYGTRYRHFPQLGNLNYRQRGGEIKLVDPEAGIPQLAAALRRGYLLIVLCTCDHVGCHRYEVARRVQAALPGTMLREAAEAFCSRCGTVLNGLARGSLCGACWEIHLRATLPASLADSTRRNEGV